MVTAICIANGPSLTREDVEYCKGRGRIYAVKEATHYAPWADFLYAADTDWWELKKGCPEFKGERWTCSFEAAEKFDLNHIDIDFQATWCEADRVASGGHSGFQAINLAYLHGADKIVLLGYDMGKGGGMKHWFDETPGLKRAERPSDYKDWLRRMRAAAPLIEIPVLNASRETAIDCFPRKSLNECLRGC